MRPPISIQSALYMSAKHNFLIYGAYGYTGQLIAEEAIRLGYAPIVAGRDTEKTKALAARLGLPHRVFDIDLVDTVAENIRDVVAVMHCGGPFYLTAATMAKACMLTGTHYLDITGEIDVFELLQDMDEAAKQAGVSLLPGVGFDVVPSDCLAAMLKEQLPDATHLVLAFSGAGQPSRGTALSMLNKLPKQGAIRQHGTIITVPNASETRTIAFDGQTPRLAVCIPWGDVYTAYVSTGIPNIKVFMAQPPKMVRFLRLTRYIGWLMQLPPVKKLLAAKIRSSITGPSPSIRENSHSYLWGEVRNAAGETKSLRIIAPEAYKLTAQTAMMAVTKVLNGDAPTGFHTPSLAFGMDFILQTAGVQLVS